MLQTADGAEILVVGAPNAAAVRAAVEAAVGRYGLPKPQISLWVLDRLQRHAASGKLRRFVPLKTGTQMNNDVADS